MSTVKIKTEPATTTTAAAAVVGVQVKLEPSLSTAGVIKLEQHSSDIDTKIEYDSEAGIKSESDDDDEDTDQATETPKKQQRFICEYHGCGRSFSSASNLGMHRHEHGIQTELNIHGKVYTLTRQSLNDRWPCPFPDCTSTYKTVGGACNHIRTNHDSIVKQQQQQQQQLPGQMARCNLYFTDVDDFYVNGVRCGYHNAIEVFFCYECRLVPECLLTHLQQRHEYDEKGIDNSDLPDSAVNANTDPNINQHSSNPHLTAAIRQPYQQHQDIIQGWICVTSDCGYCGYTITSKSVHKSKVHQGEQISTLPALILRLNSSRTHTSYFFITRLDQASGAVASNNNTVKQHKLDYSHNGLNAQDENGDDNSQDENTDASNQKRQWKCDYGDCGYLFNSVKLLSAHRREHKLEDLINVHGTTFVLNRQSSDDRWACPVPGCEAAYQTIGGTYTHILKTHTTSIRQKHANSEHENNQQHQQSIKRKQRIIQYLNVDDFYVSGTRCGYHVTTGLLICYECRLVPECLSTHLQQKHGFDEKSIDSAFLPDSAVNVGADPNINQHTNNPHIAPAIREPNQQQHQDIVQGWLCVTSDCGYCFSGKRSRNHHQYTEHYGEQQSTVPALVLRLLYGKILSSYFLITRLDTTTTTNSDNSKNSPNQFDSECDDDDGDELVLSDYSD